MKKSVFFRFLTGLFTILFLTSCPDPDPDEGPTLNVSPASVTLDASNSATLTVTSNTKWSVSSSDSWLNCSPAGATGGAQVTVTANSDNTTGKVRTATLTFTDKTGTKTVTAKVTQNPVDPDNPDTPEDPDEPNGTDPVLTVSPQEVKTSASGGSQGITVTSNTSWTAASSETWVTLSAEQGSKNGSVTLTIAENTTAKARTAEVTFKYGKDEKQIVTINQEAGKETFSIEPTELSMSVDGGSKNITVSSNIEWKATTKDTWIKLTTNMTEGTYNGVVTVTADAATTTAARTAEITFTYSNQTKTVSVSQSGITPKLTLSPSSTQEIPAGGGSFTIEVTTTPSNLAWKISKDKSWVKMDGYSSLTSLSYKGNKTVTIEADANISSSSLSATLTFTSEAGTKTLTVKQAASNILVLDDMLKYPMGNVYKNMRTSTWREVLNAVKAKYTVSEGSDYFFIYASKNSNCSDTYYCDLPFDCFYGKYYTTYNFYSYQFEIEKSKASSWRTYFTQIIADFKALGITMTESTSSSYIGRASGEANNGKYHYFIYVSDYGYYQFDVDMYYYY